MNRIFIFLLLTSFSVSAQTLVSSNPNPTTPALFLNRVPPTSLVNLTIASNDMLKDTAFVNAMKLRVNSNNKMQQFKSAFSDYIVLPNRKGGYFEILDHEATKIDGSKVELSKVLLSNSYSNKIPAAPNNGASKIEHAFYEEITIGSGNTPWFSKIAPEPGHGTSVQISTYANLMHTNYDGAYQINTPNGNSLELATTATSGIVGWARIDSTSKLFLAAKYISLPGNLEVQGSITTAADLLVGDSKTSMISITSTSISLINNNYSNPATRNNAPWKDALVLDANGAGGIVLNSVGTTDNDSGAIRFAANSRIIASFTSNGLVIGGGYASSSAILALRSENKGFILPKMFNAQILAIENVEEGTQVYSLDAHAPVFYNGTNWMQPTHFKALQNTDSAAN